MNDADDMQLHYNILLLILESCHSWCLQMLDHGNVCNIYVIVRSRTDTPHWFNR